MIINSPPKDSKFLKHAVGCSLVFLVVILILAGLICGGYYFLSRLKEVEPGDYFKVDDNGTAVSCEGSSTCIDASLKTCVPAKGRTDLGEFAEIKFEILGKSGTSCVVFAKIVDIKKVPDSLKTVPDLILKIVFEDSSMECLVPQEVYIEGLEKVGKYIGENMENICEGPLFDVAEKFNIDLKGIAF